MEASSPAITAVVAAVVGVPVGWLAWRWAQVWIDARSLEKGDTEVRLPAATAVVLTLAIFASLGWRFATAPRAVLAVYLVVFGLLVVLLLVDFGRYYLPNQLIALALGVGVAGVVGVRFLDESWPFSNALAGIVINFVVYFLFWFVAMLAFGNRGLGFGDVKLASVLGLLLGWLAPDLRDIWVLVFYAVFIGFLSGAVVSVALLRGVKLKSAFPQGPFLVLGTLAVIVFSATVLGTG